MNKLKPREIADRVLRRWEQGAEYVDAVLARELPGLEFRDRHLCQELVFGVVRLRATLDWLIDQKVRQRRPGPDVRRVLALGLYQILFTDRIPDHAVVNETVELARRLGRGNSTGLVNAVLRAYVREREATRQRLDTLRIEQPHLGYSHPQWLCDRWRKAWGPERTRELLEWNNTPPPTYARVNTLRIDPGRLLEQWRGEDVEYDFPRFSWVAENLLFELKAHPPLTQLPSFQQGAFYIQDPSTLLAVQELALRPGLTVLDLCAAPGGKTTYIAQLLQNDGQVVASDAQPARLRRLEENCSRLGVTCVQILPPPDSVLSAAPSNRRSGHGKEPGPIPPGAGRSPGGPLAPLSGLAPASCDRVLVDAPCSNTGVLRRRIDLRWRLRPGDPRRLGQLQVGLLTQAAPHLRPGGILVYSTCSLEPEENAQVVQAFLETHPEFVLERERLLVPFRDAADGTYVARLRLKPT